MLNKNIYNSAPLPFIDLKFISVGERKLALTLQVRYSP